MSAWRVSKTHIDVLVTVAIDARHPGSSFYFYHEGEGRYVTRETADEIGRMLWEENFRSVNHRYDESEPVPEYRFARTEDKPIVEVLKGIDCYEYQSCEHDEWESSAAKRFCDSLRDTLIGKLPGYDAAPWGWEEQHRGNPPVSLFEMARR